MLRFFKNIYLWGLFLFSFASVQAQNVGINTHLPDASAQLDITATNKGLLVPRISIPNLNAAAPVAAPARSLLVFNINTTTGLGYYYWDGSQWIKLATDHDVDHDWYKTTTTTNPDAISDAIFTRGRVGIGLNNPTTPSAQLEVVGGGITLHGNYGVGFSGAVPISGGITSDRAKIYYEDHPFGTHGDALIIEKTDANQTDPDGGIIFANTGADNIRSIDMVLRGNGALGLGTPTPAARLEVAAGGNSTNSYTAKFHSSASNVGAGGVVFTNTHASSATGYKWHTQNTGTNDHNDDVLLLSGIQVSSGATTTNNILHIAGNGNIGMGVGGSSEPLGIARNINNASSDDYRSHRSFINIYNTASANNSTAYYRSEVQGDGYHWGTQWTSNDRENFVLGRQVTSNGSHQVRLFIKDNGYVGLGTTNPSQKLEVIGNVRANSYITSSDKRYKTNIRSLDFDWAQLQQLRGVRYQFKKAHQDKGQGEQIGLIAQELEAVYPELVFTDPQTGYKAVDYSKLTPILLEAIKAQQVQIEALQAQQQQQSFEDLQTQLNRLKAQLQTLQAGSAQR